MSPSPLSRRAAAAGLALLLAPAAPRAQSRPPAWPTRPLRVIVPLPAGSGPDLVARALAPMLQAQLGQPAVIENRPGAGGAIGTAAIAHATDGHTIGLSIGGPATTQAVLDPALGYHPIADLAPVALLAQLPFLLLAHPGLGARDLAGFLAAARAAPHPMAYGSIGPGTVSHLLMADLAARHRLALVHVPYRGYPPAVLDLVAGRLQAGFIALPHALSPLSEGLLAGLATSGAARHPRLPGVPTLAEAGEPGAPAEAWIGLFAPAAMPQSHIARMAGIVAQALATPAVRLPLEAAGFTVRFESPEVFAHMRAAETARWAPLIRALALRITD